MMDCRQFRELLDCFADGELSAEASAAAQAHMRECAACARAAGHLQHLRDVMRTTVRAATPPPDLERRVRASLRPWWSIGGTAVRPLIAIPAAALVILGLGIGLSTRESVQQVIVTTMDRAILQVADSGHVVLDGVVLCRDCELHRRYGTPAMCERIGHHGAIATTDGRIWNIVEHPSTTELIHDNTLLGKRVRLRGRMFRAAGTITIDSYQIL